MNGPKLGTIAPPAGRVRVYQISADKLLGALPDRSIDLVIADGPYLTVNRASASGHLRDWFNDGLTWPQMSRVFALARAKLKPDGVLMAMTNNDGLREAIGAMERAGFIGIRTITWDRQYPGLGRGDCATRPSSSSSAACPVRGPCLAPIWSGRPRSDPARPIATPPPSPRAWAQAGGHGWHRSGQPSR